MFGNLPDLHIDEYKNLLDETGIDIDGKIHFINTAFNKSWYEKDSKTRFDICNILILANREQQNHALYQCKAFSTSLSPYPAHPATASINFKSRKIEL